MTTQNNALENIENAEKTPDPSSKIKELDDLDRFLIKAVKRAPFVAPVFFITCFFMPDLLSTKYRSNKKHLNILFLLLFVPEMKPTI